MSPTIRRASARGATEIDTVLPRMNFISDRLFADPDVAARKIAELANAFEPVQDGRIYLGRSKGRSCSS